MFETINEHWSEIKEYMRMEFGLLQTSYETWIIPLKVIDTQDGILTILYPEEDGESIIQFINHKYLNMIRVSIEAITKIALDSNHIRIVSKLPQEEAPSLVTPPSIAGYSSDVPPKVSNLDPKYTFDTFVVGNNNKLAHAASLAVAERPGEKKYNPLFLYGGPGLGKTHLMHSIANFILHNDPTKKVLYISGENFTNEFIESIRTNKMPTFRAKFRNLDILLVDDIQFLANREGIQEEFFHTYEALRNANKALVFSSDKPPKELPSLAERLRSRLNSGIAADISAPDFETRMAILRRKEELEGINVDNEVLNYIATNIRTNIRDLEGALNQINSYSLLCNREINLATAEEALRDLINPKESRAVTPELIISVVADHYHITQEDLCSSKRTKNLTIPRQVAMYLCKEMTSLTWGNIGDTIGKKDRTTVMHGAEKIQEDIKTDETLRRTIEIIQKKINPS